SVGPNHPNTVAVQSELAGVHLSEGDLLAAEPLIRAVAERNREWFPNDPRLAFDESRLAQLHTRFGVARPARRHIDQYLQFVRRSEGPESLSRAFGLMMLADVYLLDEDLASALRVAQQALDIRRRILGTDHPLVALAYRMVAGLRHDLGRFREAR